MAGQVAASEQTLVVVGREEVADGVVSLRFEPVTAEPLPDWDPGAHIDLVLPNGLVRQYSLCGDPRDRRTWRIAVVREPASRGGSAYVHQRLSPGTRVLTRGPRNHFRLEPSRRYVFIAGGIGITPLIPMMAAATTAGADWSLLYGGRTASSIAFADELRARYGDRVDVRPQDEHGLLDLPAAIGTPLPDTKIYCCGPAPLLDAVTGLATTWPADALHLERFTALPRDDTRNTAFTVRLARSGLTVQVDAGTSVLDALADAGVAVLSSCEDGVCGTCITPVLGGTPDHRDSVLSAAERASGTCMTICVSRTTDPALVLDL